MTELQMGLIGLGGFAVVGVVAYNKWQEIRQRRQAEQALQANHPDVLLDDARNPDVAAVETEERAASFAISPLQEVSFNDPGPAAERIEPVLL
ncbi:MAG: cell division protein FtsZ, partial [Propionivibrio sp.]